MNRNGIGVLAAGLVAIIALAVSANAAPPPSHNNNPPPSHNPPGNSGFGNNGNNGNSGNNGFGNNGNNGFGNNGNNGFGNNGNNGFGNNGNNGFGNNGNNGQNFNNSPPRLNSNPPPQLSSNPPRLNNSPPPRLSNSGPKLNNDGPKLTNSNPPKLNNSGPKLNNDGPKLTNSNPPPKLNNSGPKLNNDGFKLTDSNTPPKLNNSGPKLNNDGPKLTNSNPPKLNNSGPKLNNDGPKLTNSNPPKLNNNGPKLNNDGPKLTNSNPPPKLNNSGPKLNNDGLKLTNSNPPPKLNNSGPKLTNSSNGSKLNGTGPKLNGNAPPKALTDAKYRPRPELTEKIKQHQMLGLQKNKELGKERGLSLADQNAAIKKNATPEQLDKLKIVTQKAQVAQAASHRPFQTGKSIPQKTTVAPQGSLSLLGKGDAKTLSNAGKDNPGYQTAMSHVTGKQQLLSQTGYNKGRLLSSTDYQNMQKQLGTTSLNNPKVLIPANNLLSPVGGRFVTPSLMNTIINNATDPKSSLTQAQKTVAEKFVLNKQPFTAQDVLVANSIQNDPKLSPAAKAAFSQMSKTIQKDVIQKDFNQAMQNLTGGGFIPFGSLGGPASGFTTNDNGDLVASGGDGYPPFMQTTWLSADQSVDTTTALGADGVPDGPGIDLAVLPGGDSATGDGTGDNGGDADVTLGGLASAAAIEQPTRYLRATNDTDQPVTLYVQYHTMKDDNQWAWYAGDPDADSAQPLEFHLEPGETADLGDNGWRINADKVRIWGASETVAWQNFKDVDLWLVPEVDADGNHGYEDQDVETFSFTLN